MSHSPEPWRILRGQKYPITLIESADGTVCEVTGVANRDDLERIIAAVNACRYIPTELLRHLHLGEILDTLALPDSSTLQSVLRQLKKAEADMNAEKPQA